MDHLGFAERFMNVRQAQVGHFAIPAFVRFKPVLQARSGLRKYNEKTRPVAAMCAYPAASAARQACQLCFGVRAMLS